MKTPIIAAGLAFAFGGAQALTLDFGNAPTPAICSASSDGSGALALCLNGTHINQAYGDVAGVVDVSYSQPSNSGESLRWWDTSYNDLYGVLWADGSDGDSRARIELKPLNGGAVALTSFDFGAFPNNTLGTVIDVYAIGGATPLFHYDSTVGAPPTHSSPPVNVSSPDGLWIEWKNSAFNVGIDNIVFSVQAVPEPTTWALMLGGLGLLAAAGRRRGC